MKSLLRAFILFAPFALASLLSAADERPVLPEDVFPVLRQVMADAAKQSPRMVAANLAQLVADGELKQAKAGLYPTIGGFYTTMQTKDKREDIVDTLDTEKTYYSFSLNQPIFHWGERRNNARIGEISRQIADENYQEAYRLLAQEIRTAYLVIVLRKVQLANAVYSKTLADQALALAEDRMEKGEISEGAVFQPRIGVEQANLSLETARWDFTVAKQNFATLTGQPELADAQIPTGIPAVPETLDSVDRELARFLAQDEPDTASARIQRRTIVINDLSYRNQRTRLRPKVSFVAGISQDEQSYTTNIAAKYGLQSQYVALQASWTIFDGFASRGGVASALARKRASEHEYKQLTDRLAQAAQRSAKAVALAQKQMNISDRLLENARQFLDFTKADFARGQASEAQVNAAQAGYNQQLSGASAARYTYLVHVTDFVSTIGRDPAVLAHSSN